MEPKILPKNPSKNSRAAKFPTKISRAKNFHEQSSKFKILIKIFLKPKILETKIPEAENQKKKILEPKI